MKFKCLITDDEPLAINVIKNHLNHFNDFEVVATCSNAMEAFNFLKENPVDLLFLDINMPGLSGIDFIRNIDDPPAIVITTAYREYAVEGYELDVLDYLVKPIPFGRFMKAIDKVTNYLRLQEKGYEPLPPNDAEDFIFVKVDKKIVKIFFADILYIESLKDYVRIKTVYEDLITHHTLTGITKSLPQDKFARIHRSYTVSLDKIKSLEGNYLNIGNKSLPLGRMFQKDLKSFISNKSIDLI